MTKIKLAGHDISRHRLSDKFLLGRECKSGVH